jgi:hypothetical protein
MSGFHRLIVTVSVTAITLAEEHHFAALDRHGRDMYETRHNIQLVLHTHISIIGIEVAISMIQAIILNATLLHICLLLLIGVEFLHFDMPH